MNEIEEFVDDRQKSWCVHCGGWIAGLDASDDHVPSRCLLQKPHPPHLPKIRVCAACNEGFSLDEEYLVAFLGSVLEGSTDPGRQSNPVAARILERSPKLRSRIKSSKSEYKTCGGETRTIWRPEMERVNRIIVKNARGHAFFERGEPMLNPPAHIWAAPVQALAAAERLDFENVNSGSGWPEVGSRMMTRLITGQDFEDGWIIVQEGVYRYAVIQADGLLVRSVLREYLAAEVWWSDFG